MSKVFEELDIAILPHIPESLSLLTGSRLCPQKRRWVEDDTSKVCTPKLVHVIPANFVLPTPEPFNLKDIPLTSTSMSMASNALLNAKRASAAQIPYLNLQLSTLNTSHIPMTGFYDSSDGADPVITSMPKTMPTTMPFNMPFTRPSATPFQSYWPITSPHQIPLHGTLESRYFFPNNPELVSSFHGANTLPHTPDLIPSCPSPNSLLRTPDLIRWYPGDILPYLVFDGRPESICSTPYQFAPRTSELISPYPKYLETREDTTGTCYVPFLHNPFPQSQSVAAHLEAVRTLEQLSAGYINSIIIVYHEIQKRSSQ